MLNRARLLSTSLWPDKEATTLLLVDDSLTETGARTVAYSREGCFPSEENRGAFLEVPFKLGLEGWVGGGWVE